MVFGNVSFGWGIHQMNLIDVKKQNEWSQQAMKLK